MALLNFKCGYEFLSHIVRNILVPKSFGFAKKLRVFHLLHLTNQRDALPMFRNFIKMLRCHTTYDAELNKTPYNVN